jgi:hypothetical protein
VPLAAESFANVVSENNAISLIRYTTVVYCSTLPAAIQIHTVPVIACSFRMRMFANVFVSLRDISH